MNSSSAPSYPAFSSVSAVRHNDDCLDLPVAHHWPCHLAGGSDLQEEVRVLSRIVRFPEGLQ